MDDIINTISTVITILSLIINFATYIPKFFKWLTDRRYLRAVLLGKNKHFIITQSLFRPGMISSTSIENYTVVTENSVISIQKIVKLLEKTKISYDVLQTNKEHYDEIHVGGPISNINTNAYVTQYFPNFHFVDQKSRQYQHENYYNIHRSLIDYAETFHGFLITASNDNQSTYKFPVDDENDYMFLIKLTSRELNCEKTVHLIFGGSDIGTLVATDYFTKCYKNLYKLAKKDRYFIAIPVHRTNKSAAISKLIDLSKSMFND